VYRSSGFAFGAFAAFGVSSFSTSFAARFFASLVPCFFIGVLLLSDWGSNESCPERERFDMKYFELLSISDGRTFMSKQDLEALGYKEEGERFCDQPGCTESDVITQFRNRDGKEILLFHKYKLANEDRYFVEVSLKCLQDRASKPESA